MKELIEKVSAIREYLMALNAQVTDVKKLADLVKQQDQRVLHRNYEALYPYMTVEQQSRVHIGGFETLAETCQLGEEYHHLLTDAVTKRVPRMLADLDDIAKKLGNNAAPAPKS